METLKVQLRVAAASLAAVVVCVIGVPQIAAADGSLSDVTTPLYAAAVATGTGDCSSLANACALGTALSEVTAGGTIVLVTPGVEGTSSSYYSGGFSISTAGTSALSPVTIEPLAGLATAPILDGGGTQQVLTVGDLYLDLSGVTVQHGAAGAGPLEGGGIANAGGHLSVSNALFSDNSAGNHQGGGIANYSSGHLSVSNTVFSDNIAGFGGAIANGSSGTGTLTVTSSTFSANTSFFDGGAIANGDSGSKVSQGAGNGTAAITDSTFSGNHSGVGGALSSGKNPASQGTLTVSGSTFSDDSAARGGAISSGDTSGTGTLTISNSTFSGNSATDNGGAIDNGDDGSNGTLTVTASTFSGNSATGHGGAIDSGAAGTNVDAVTVDADIFAEGCDEASGTWTDNGYNVGSDGSCFSGGTGDDDSAGSNLASLLGPLENNGGPTETMALLDGNPAIAIVPNPTAGLCSTTDQRGIASATGTSCDAGAVQLGQNITFTSPPTSAQVGLRSYTPIATATSGLPVTIAVDPSSSAVCHLGAGAVVTFTGAGTCQLDGTQAGDGGINWPAAQGTQSFAVGTSVTTVTLSPPSVHYGAEYTETFGVRVSAGGATPQGTVVVHEGGVTLCTVTLVARRGQCRLSRTQLSVGTYGVTAVFHPTSPDFGTSSSVSQSLLVRGDETVTTLRPSLLSATYGEENEDTFNVRVAAVGATPQGTVAVQLGSATLCTSPLSAGVGTCSLSADQLRPGAYRLEAVYTPSTANFIVSTSVHALVVSPSATLAAPAIATTPGAGGAVGATSVTDTARLSDGSNPTGTISFDLYSDTCFSAPVYTDIVTVSGNGTYSTAMGNNPGGYLAPSPGTYYWVAAYGGDPHNGQVTSGCGEPVTLTVATPIIATTQQQASVVVGSVVTDQATVSGGDAPTGTVTFRLFDNPDGTGTPLFTDTENLVSGSATSANYTTTGAGTDYWVATYNGDGNNAVVSNGSADEPVTVSQATPTISASPDSPTEPLINFELTVQATVSGGYSPTGTVTFRLYENPDGTGSPIYTYTYTNGLVDGHARAVDAYFVAAGTYYWVATYNGDANNTAVSSGLADAPVTVTPSTPSIATTQQPASVTAGSVVADQATVSGGYETNGTAATGTVTFNLYDNSDGTGTPLFTDTEILVNGGFLIANATSASYTTTAAGTDYWVATYNGDDANAGISSGLADEPVIVSQASPSIALDDVPTPPENQAPPGSLMQPEATVSGGDSPTGTVTFYVYANDNCTGGPEFTDTEALGSGIATSTGFNFASVPNPDTYYWVATYNGDSNNLSVSTSCSGAPVVITPDV